MADQQQRGGAGRQDRASLAQSNLSTLRTMFQQMQKQLEAALPKFMTVERMIRVATTTVQRVPKLLECHPVTVVGAIMQSAQLGLEPDNVTGQAYLVPFWNSKNNRMECNLIPGYRGLMALARRSKEITAFDAHVVHAGDEFDFEFGSRQYLRHRPNLGMEKNDKGIWIPKVDGQQNGAAPETIAAYMIAFYGGDALGQSQFHVMFRPELDKAKEFTKSRDRQGEITGPWIEHPDAMRQKTVIRRGAKLLPFSIELATAVNLEERAIEGKSQNLGNLGADVLGQQFEGASDDDEGETIDPELTKQIDAGFALLGYTEARRTVKMQEFRGKLPDLVQWLEAEARKTGKDKPAAPAAGETKAAEADTKPAPAETTGPKPETNAGKKDTPAGNKPRGQGRFKI